MSESQSGGESDIAIIGMAGRFPKADNLEQFWSNLVAGRDCVTFFEEEELAKANVKPAELQRAGYVKANQVLSGIELFDADFFGIHRAEAEILDPQHRLLLECAHTALEDAGYDPKRYDGLIGVYVGAGMNTYLLQNLRERYREASSVEHYQLMLASDKDFLATRISYKLNLKGPSLCINTACSTSLVAVHIACLSLLSGECAMALAGSVSIRVPQIAGYQYQEGMIFSPDGHCRTFSRDAAGTILGNGLGAIVLKRRADAIRDRDTIYAVIKGSAVNNDGSLKAGYTAPSIEGQAGVVADALAIAGVEPDSISYLEAHGTATPLGDPIEVSALTLAHRKRSDKRQYCALGSVKTNIGHLDTAAGIAGLIKTVLMLKYQTLVPSLHFSEPNPAIDFESSPFFVQSRTAPWVVREAAPRRAGVSAFGIGGTNAHVILEEAPGLERASAPPRPELILISAKSAAQLDEATLNLAKHLRRYPDLALGDVAFTLSTGRQHHAWRRVVIGADTREVALSLALVDPEKVITRESISTGRGVTYLLNDSRRDIAASVRKLWQSEPVFRQHFAECAHEAPALREFDASGCSRALRFAATYACARLFLSMGIQPSAIKASGAGELVAACLAGSLSLAEALGAVEQYEADQPHIAEDELAEPGAAITLDVNEALESIPRALGSLWLLGLDIAWERCFEGREARRVPLPTYVFQRQRYWVDEQGAAPAEATNQSKSELARQVNEASGSARVRILSTHLQKQIAGMLGLPASELPDIHQSFMELKLESLTLIEIVTRLSGELSLTIPASALVEFPTIAAFSSRVTELWDGASGSQSIAETAPLAETDARRAALEDQRRRRRNTRMSSIEA